ncbi:MAG: ComEC/Rec2 family competence protein [Thermoguttaceae bacterium]
MRLFPAYQPLVVVCVAAAVGILVDRHCPIPLCGWTVAAGGSLLVWSACFWGGSRRPRKAMFAGNAAVLLGVVCVAGAWHHCRWALFTADELGRFARQEGAPVCVEAVVVQSPRQTRPTVGDPLRRASQAVAYRLLVDVVALRDGSIWRPVSGRVMLLALGERPNVAAGDTVRCFARLTAPRCVMNPGGYDYAARCRSERTLCRLLVDAPACMTVVRSGSVWNVWRLLDSVRWRGRELLRQSLSPDQADLADAVLLGFREELDQDRNEAFLVTGTVHMLSISGLHVGLLAAVLFWLAWRSPLSRGLAIGLVATLTTLYALMVDAEAPVVRASILVLVACAALWLRKRPFGFNSLAAAALVVLAVNPSYLFDVGAQLSFLCVAVLIWTAPARPRGGDDEVARRSLDRLVMANLGWPERTLRRLGRRVLSITWAGVAIWLVTGPLVMARFNIVSLAAIVLNVVLWPLVSLALLSGFGLLVVGAVSLPLAWLFGVLCNWNFALLEGLIALAGRTPWSHVWLPGPADWWLWGFYGGLGVLAVFPSLRSRRGWCVALLLGWIAVGVAASCPRRNPKRLDCTVLSVGHGCAVVLELPSGETVLYDAGQLGAPKAAVRAVSGFLWSRGLRGVDAIVLSHPDADHYNAVPDLLERFSVGAVYVSSSMFENRNQAVAGLRAAIDRHGVPIREIRADDCILKGAGYRVDALHPARQALHGERRSENSNSVVLAVNGFGRRVLLPGDLESAGLDKLLARKRLPCDVLLAPHHGSRRSGSSELAAWCRSRWVIFSGDGRWSRPESDTHSEPGGRDVLHTCRSGAIRVRITATSIALQPFHGAEDDF